jgi:hypothetical protein
VDIKFGQELENSDDVGWARPDGFEICGYVINKFSRHPNPAPEFFFERLHFPDSLLDHYIG